MLKTSYIPALAVAYTMAWTQVAVASNEVGVAAGLRLSALPIRQLAPPFDQNAPYIEGDSVQRCTVVFR